MKNSNKEIIENILLTNVDARDNDILLLYEFCVATNRPITLKELAITESHNILESVRRCRQRLQETNENLRGKNYGKRNAYQEIVKETIKSI